MDMRWEAWIAGLIVKTGLIFNHHRFSRGITGGDLRPKAPAEIQVHRGPETKLGAARDDFQAAVHSAPLVFLLHAFDHPDATQAPTPPREAVQTVTAFIDHPYAYAPTLRQRQGPHLLQQMRWERGGRRGVLFSVYGTRHLQRPCAFSQPVIQAPRFQADTVFAFQPGGQLRFAQPAACA